ncbi:hypothetical protein [Serratia fonticola]|uniref:hypothetical protein n=1 Tax=Serratia fonticola TaxID=47917 RepID=UPI0027F8B34F|nr:hypothetical protein [Serratia fonticola]MDQ7208482.1 hypothetical protein [Serratia fonticola]HBE9078605.1 hypothetical protein [Serratia fonticola]HBE9151697.1 hypothetical protein [Serratia fonticola]
MSKFEDMTPEQIVELLSRTGKPYPKWMLDVNNMKSNEKLTDAEVLEFAECHTEQLRTCVALHYLISCKERFGVGPNGQLVFKHQNVTMEISRDAIELLLKFQLEAPLLEEPPKHQYVTVMQFYQGDELKREQEGSTWMRDFIDEVFIEGAKAMIEGEAIPAKNLH